MNKIEKKLRKIKGLYNLLNEQIKQKAIADVKKECGFRSANYPEFAFDYSMVFSSIELKVFKNKVSDYYDFGMFFGDAFGLNYYELMDVMFSCGEDFVGVNMVRFNEYIEQLTKFVRKALKGGIDSMNYGVQIEYVKVTNYLDFEEKTNV